MKQYDYLIVGSGLFGATFAYKATKLGKKCLVIDKRSHLGGNVYCENVEGINVHKYGAHIFHTNNKEVWDFVNGLVPFNRYTNSPVANYHGKIYNLPFNMNTFYQMWGVMTPEQATAKIEEQKAEAVAKMKAEGVTEPRNLEEQGLSLVGKDIFERLIKEYTEKQWGRPCRELPAFIIKRLPVRLVFDNNYFNDAYQGIPIGGYNKLIEALMGEVEYKTTTDFFRSEFKDWQKFAKQLVYTGPIDEYFNFCYGKLDWRTVSFKTKIIETPNYQGNAVINYTSHAQPYTRVIEHKHFEMFGSAVYDCPKTVISEEYSTEYREGMEQYYPINDSKNNEIAEKYRELARKEKNVIFGGRLADYKYYDMAPIIENVLKIFKKEEQLLTKSGKVAAIVVTFNRLNLLKRCISSLRTQTYQKLDIYVVNNGSTDGTTEWLNKQNDVIAIHQENKGGAGGFYSGMKNAFEKNYDWIWMMDDDGVADTKQLENLIKGTEETGSLFVNALVCDITHNGSLSFGISYDCEEIKTIERAQKHAHIKNSINPFNGTLIHREVISKIGFIKKEMFIWGDETEYSLRARKYGFTLYTITDAIHFHPHVQGKEVNIIPLLNKHKIQIKPKDKVHIYYRNLGYLYQTYSLKGIERIIKLHTIYYATRFNIKGLIKMFRYFKKGRNEDFLL